MAAQATVTISTAATLLFTAPNGGSVTIRNEDAAIKVFIGSATVTNSGATAGVSLAAGASITIPLKSNEPIFAVAASATPAVSVVFSA